MLITETRDVVRALMEASHALYEHPLRDARGAMVDFVREAGRAVDPRFGPPRTRFDLSRSWDDAGPICRYEHRFREGDSTSGILVRQSGTATTELDAPTVQRETLTMDAYGLAAGQVQLELESRESGVMFVEAKLTLRLDGDEPAIHVIERLFAERFAQRYPIS